jgi:pimeloyl-ACP methyl ester carboxylesterase
MNNQQRFIMAGVYTFLALFFGTLLAQVQTQTIASEAVRYFPNGSDFVQVGYPPKALHYIRRGSGPTVVLIHGDGGSTYDWTMSNFDSLARHYDVIAIDRPGFGFSETLPHQSIISQVRYIHRGLQLMGVRRPVLVGHSRGGEVATLYAEEYPDDIAGVVTLGGACFNTTDHEPNWQHKLLRMPVVGPYLAYTVYVLFGREPTKAGLNQAFLPTGKAPKRYADTYTALLLRPQTLQNWAIDHDVFVLDSLIVPRYKTIRVPFVVVNGQADHNVPIAMARRYSQQIPGARLLEVPGAGHELMFSHPAVVERAIAMVLQPRNTFR